MKIITALSLPILCIVGIFFEGTPDKEIDKKIYVSELTDIKAVTFARNLRDWKGRKVDSLVLDIFYPTGATSKKKYPLLVFCHGSDFSGGNRLSVTAFCDKFADQGFITVGVDYRLGYDKNDEENCLSDSVTYNAALYRASQDINAATRFLVANAEKYNIDTNWIFTAGSSGGASLALFQGYLDDSVAKIYYPAAYTQLGGLQSSGNSYTNTFTIKGMCSMWGAFAHAPMIIKANYRVIPTILFKGDEDGSLPDSAGYLHGCENLAYVYTGVSIFNLIRAQNQPAVFHTLPLAGHAAYDNGFCVENASCFFRAIMNAKPYSGQYQYFNTSCN